MPSRGPLFIIAGRPGLLGNQLYFFSYVISLALKTGGRVANPGFHDYAEAFAGTHADALCRWPSQGSMLRGKKAGKKIFDAVEFVTRVFRKLRLRIPGVKFLGIHEAQTSDYALQNEVFLATVRGARVVFIAGWLELSKIHFEAPAKLQTYFAPIGRYRAAADAAIDDVRKECDLLVGVHIRQGDYAGFENGRFYFTTAAYMRKMLAVPALFSGKKVGFIVCSNMEQSISHPLLLVVRSGPGGAIEDLYTLASCDYIIAPPSTFSRWASFYGQIPLWELRDEDSVPRLEEFQIRG